MTLVELLVSMSIGLIVLAALGTFMVYTARSFAALGNYNDLDQASRLALDVMSRDIRQVKSVSTYSSNDLTFVNYDGTALRYFWDPATRTLRRTVRGRESVLLTECNYLRFGISQRNPSNNFNFYPPSNTTLTKLVDVSWSCSRDIMQRAVNTEQVQTAKIVIRN